MMKTHVVFGAGLIGGFLGGVLSSLNLPTYLVARPRVKKQMADGLLLSDYLHHEAFVPKLHFIDANDIPKGGFNYLWLTVKCTAVLQASKDIKPLVGPHTIILCCQNGLGSDAAIKACFPKNSVLRVMVPFNVAELKPGHLHRGSEGTLYIERLSEVSNEIDALVKEMDIPIMPVSTSTDMNALLWAKLQLNLGNSVNALADIPVKAMLEQRPYRLVIAALMKELLAVAKARQIQLPKLTALPAQHIPKLLPLPSFLYKIITKKVLAIDPTVKSSMWWDLSQGKKTEIDYLNGAVVAEAEKLGISCPANKNIIQLIKEAENTPMEKRKGGISGESLLRQLRTMI